jgi:hypothetical protein
MSPKVCGVFRSDMHGNKHPIIRFAVLRFGGGFLLSAPLPCDSGFHNFTNNSGSFAGRIRPVPA